MRLLFLAFSLLMVSTYATPPSQPVYDPLLIDKYQPEYIDLTVKDEKRSREIPIRVYLPKEKKRAPIGDADVASRLAVFAALPPGGKYELVLCNAEHSVFTERALPRDTQPRNPNHHRSILAVTTAFWDSYLRNDPNAQKWLNGDRPRKVLEKEDRWQRK